MKGLDTAEFTRWWLQRPTREKLMLGACSLGVVLALGDSLAVTPVEKRLRAARGAEEQLQARWDQLQQRRKGQAAQETDLHEVESNLRKRLKTAQARASEQNKQLADTAQLPHMLRDLVATMGTTQLLELSFVDNAAGATAANPAAGTAGMAAAARAAMALVPSGLLPQALSPTASPGAAPASTPAASPSAAAPRRIHQLPVTLKVSGSWVELTRLLSEVEDKAPALQWQSLSLDSKEWPAIQLTLRAHVRSLQPRWGVGS